jgi:hypothetical protein
VSSGQSQLADETRFAKLTGTIGSVNMSSPFSCPPGQYQVGSTIDQHSGRTTITCENTSSYWRKNIPTFALPIAMLLVTYIIMRSNRTRQGGKRVEKLKQ